MSRLVFIVLAFPGCSSYHSAVTASVRETLVPINGHTMHLLAEGHGPTVILSAGGAGYSRRAVPSLR